MSGVEECRTWFEALISAWRSRFAGVSDSQRSGATRSLINLSPPVQAAFYICRTVPVEAVCIMIRHDSQEPDRAVSVSELDEAGRLVSGAPTDDRALKRVWERLNRLRAHLDPQRPLRPPLKAWQIPKVQGEDEEVQWTIPGGLHGVEVQNLVDFAFRDEPPASPPVVDPRMAGPHIYAVGQYREEIATDRWIESPNGPQLLAQLGLSGMWWCGIRLSRSLVLNGLLDGDIDIVAGPLDRTEGVIQWPPRMDSLVACEIKASWFDAVDSEDGWRRKHTSEAREIQGQIALLLGKGFNRVGFFHVSATKPSGGSGNPWLVALDDSDRGAETLPMIFRPGELPPCVGYFSAEP